MSTIEGSALKSMDQFVDTEISFTEEYNDIINNTIAEFADMLHQKGQSAEHYVKNRSAPDKKVYHDIFLGKKAEYFVAEYMHQTYNLPLLKPDLEIREGKKKGWYPDLPYSQEDWLLPDIHVKSCNQGTVDLHKTHRGYPDYSWTFQYSNSRGRGGQDELFKLEDTNCLLALVFMDNELSHRGTIKVVAPWVVLKNYLDDPLIDWFKGKKLCLYHQNLLANRATINV